MSFFGAKNQPTWPLIPIPGLVFSIQVEGEWMEKRGAMKKYGILRGGNENLGKSRKFLDNVNSAIK